MKTVGFATVLALGLMVPALAQAEESDFFPLEDQVILNLQTEGWVTTETAQVGIQFNVVQQKESAGDIRQEILDKLQKLAADANWHVTSSSQSKDQTGLNRWYVSAEARIAEKHVASLQDVVEKVSRPGFKASVSYVNFSPSFEEQQTLMSDLRTQIYKLAAAEAKRLNAAFEGAKYRVRVVDFLPAGSPSPRVMAMPRAKAMTAEMDTAGSQSYAGNGGGGAQMPISQKGHLSATVVLGQESADVK
jgi:predicted secreted protein